MKHKILIAVPVVIVLLLGIAVAAPGFIDWNQYKTQAQDQIRITTGHTAELRGNISMSLLPTPHVSIQDVQIAAPQGSTNDYLLKLSRADVNLAFLPLLTGKIDFSSVTLIEPQIALEVFQNGKQNWMTPELEKLTGKDADPNAPKRKTPDVSLKDFSIEKGNFAYIDRSKKDSAPLTISDINVDAGADTLSGPFNFDGSFVQAGRKIEIEAKTGAIDESQSLQVNARGRADPGVDFTYQGVIATAEPIQAQGETTLEIKSLKEVTGNKTLPLDDDSLNLKGLVTATKEKVEFKNAVFGIASNQFSGDLSAVLSPLKITGDFAASDTVNLDKFIKSGGKSSGNLKGQIIPETITLPMPIEAGIKLSAPALVYNGQMYKNITLMASKQDKIFAVDFAAAGIPGTGKMDAKAAAKYAAMTASQKDGSQTYSDPTLAVTLKADSQNISQTAEAITGTKIAALDMWKSGSINANAAATANSLSLKDTTVRLGESNFTVGGSYTASGARPKLVADIATDRIDIDAMQAKMGKSDSNATLEDTIRSLSLPMDLDFDFGAENAHWQGKDIKGLRAQGTFRENALSFTNLSAQDFAGAAFKANGGISNLKELSGIDVTVSGAAGDAKELAKMAGLDVSALPKSLENANLAISAKGSSQKLAMSADIKALNGNLIAKGDVDQPMGKYAISNMAVQVKHRNLAEALQLFSPGSTRYVSLEKPLDFYAEIDRQGNLYTLKNMKANVAGSPVTGSLSVDTGASKPTVRGDLAFTDLTIQTGAAAKGVPKSGEKWSSATMDTTWMNSYEADLAIKANSITYQNWNMQKPVINVALHGGKLNISNLDAGLFGGQMAMTASAEAGSGNKGFSSLSSTASFKSVLMEELVKAFVGTKIIQATGDVNFETSISTSGTSQAALVSNLKGDGTVDGKKIVMDGFDLVRFANAMSAESKPGDTVQGLLGTSLKGGSTSFDTLDGSFEINQGLVNISKLDLDGELSSVTTKGTINLPQWTLKTAHTITVKPTKVAAGETAPEPVPPFTINISGSLDNPAQTVGQGLLSDYLNRKIQRKVGNVIQDKFGKELEKKGLGGLLGGLTGQPTGGTTTAPAPAPAVQQAPVQQAVPEATPQAIEPAAQDAPEPAPTPTPTTETPPAAEQAPALAPEQPAEKTDEEKAQEAIKGLLQGLTGH